MRILNNYFEKELMEGFLNPLLERVILDSTLDLEIRENYFNIYYRGGSILRLEPKGKTKHSYNAKFDFNYFKGTGEREVDLPTTISTKFETECWVRNIGYLKNGMDLWFGKHPKDERAFQQILVYDNNGNKGVAHGTDYFISDIEYDNRQGARFDALAIRWHSTASARKLSKKYKPRLTLIEMKYGDSALIGEAGMLDHFKQNKIFVKDENIIKELKKEVIKQFQQKRDLGLVPALNSNSYKITKLDEKVDVLFVLANHKPTDTKLQKELLKCQEINVDFNVLFSQAKFHGYGLYESNMYTLENIINM